MKLSYAQAISIGIKEEMLKDKTITIIGEDIGLYGGVYKATAGLYDFFGDGRVKDTPISESAILGVAIGASILGYKTIVEIMYLDFLTIASDQLVNHAAKLHYMSGGKIKVPIVVRTQGGAGIRNAAQHSQSLEAWYMHIPGIKVVMPSNVYDAKGLIKSSILDDNPVIFIEHKKCYSIEEDIPKTEYYVPIGKAKILMEGSDLTIISNSFMIYVAKSISNFLKKEYKISCEVIDLRTLKPLDVDTILNSVIKTNNVVIINEACKTGNIASEIISIIQERVFDYLDNPIMRICAPDTPVPYSPELEDFYIINKDESVNKILKHFNFK